MKFTYRAKCFLALAAVSFFSGAVDCAALGARQNQETSIQATIEQWASIEHSFIYEKLFDSENIGGG